MTRQTDASLAIDSDRWKQEHMAQMKDQGIDGLRHRVDSGEPPARSGIGAVPS